MKAERQENHAENILTMWLIAVGKNRIAVHGTKILIWMVV